MFDRTLLLPPQQTPFEAGMVHAMAIRPETDPSLLRTLYRPDAIPERLLPWLAYAWDAPHWPDDPALRRQILAASLAWHRIAGTLAAFRQLAEWQGVTITRAVLPPTLRFLGGGFNRAQWLAGLPLLRWYISGPRAGQVWIIDDASETQTQLVTWDAAAIRPWPPATRVGYRAFAGGSYYGASFFALDRSTRLAERLAVLPQWRFTVRQTGRLKGRRTFAGASFYGASYLATDRAGHIVTGKVGTSPNGWEWNPTCHPGTRVIDRDGEAVEDFSKGHRAFAGGSYYGAADLSRDRASHRQWRIVPAALPSRGFPLLAHAGAAVGMPPYHAKLYLRLTGQAPAWDRAFFGAGHYGAHHFGNPERPHRFHRIVAGLRPAKAARDRVYIGLEPLHGATVCPEVIS